MKPFSSLVVGLFATVHLAFGAHSAIDPIPREDQGWKARHSSFNKRVGEVGKKAQLVFIGDSITQGWEGQGKEVWAENYAKYDAVNLGIGGDRTQHVLWRLENGNLEGLSPKAAVLMIGTNNSNNEDNTAEQIAEGVRAIVKKLRTSLPTTKILLVSIFPRGENPNPQRGKILQANQIIQKLVDGENVIWVDFGHQYLNDQGQIPREIMPDYLHLSKQGYQMWADALAKPLSNILGTGPQAGNADLSGEWIATLPGPNNEPVELPFTLKASGGKVTGSFQPEGRELKIEDGTVNGSDISWMVKRVRSNGDVISYKMTGKLQGDKIAGKSTTQLEGNDITVDWTARRK